MFSNVGSVLMTKMSINVFVMLPRVPSTNMDYKWYILGWNDDPPFFRIWKKINVLYICSDIPEMCRNRAMLYPFRHIKSYHVCVPRPVADNALQWRHNDRDGVSNHQPPDCLLNRLFRRRSKKTAKLRVTGLCEGNSPVTGEFPAQRASNAENLSIWCRHHEMLLFHNTSLPAVHLECVPMHYITYWGPNKMTAVFWPPNFLERTKKFFFYSNLTENCF